jgi:hypothetical protein
MNWFKEAGKDTVSGGKSTTSNHGTLATHPLLSQPCGGASNTYKPPPLDNVIFVERTWDGDLYKLLREKEAELGSLMGSKIRLVEQAGTQLRRLLVSSDPWRQQRCWRPSCHPCGGDEKNWGSSTMRNLVYASFCLLCKKEGRAVKSWSLHEGPLNT